MLILSLDLGRRMGVADGDSSILGKAPPSVEAVILRGTSVEHRARYLAGWLHERLYRSDYGLIITESPMNPAASKSSDATIAQLYLHGALQGVAEIFGLEVETVPVMAVRKHFCGQACAPRITGRKRTLAEARVAREFINTAVLARAILLGYLPRESKDWDQANACALWDFGCAKFARAMQKTLVLYEESP